MKWVQTYGGPLIVLGSGALPYWRGTLGRSASSFDTDYERASAKMSAYVSEIETSGHIGFVIGDTPMPTTVVEGDVTSIVSLRYAPQDFDVESAMRGLEPEMLQSPASLMRYFPRERKHFLFDATLAGREVGRESITFELSARPHAIETHPIERGDEVAFLVHVMRPLNA